jgi:sensory rhodopsin
VATLSGKPNDRKYEAMFFTGLVMFNGFLASYITLFERWWFFALSSVAFVGLLLELFYDYKKQKGMMKQIMWLVIIGWSLFPVVWVLAPTGFAVITVFIESILYAILDLITKIGFGIYVIFRMKQPATK